MNNETGKSITEIDRMKHIYFSKETVREWLESLDNKGDQDGK